MQKVLVSACLLGKKVRYDGKVLSMPEKILTQWIAAGRVVSICPEVDAGMSIPRAPAEILNGDGFGVWAGSAFVVEDTGLDVTVLFKKGATRALQLCVENKIKVAVLTESSPSCGSSSIYDGNFTSTKIDGLGVTAALLQENGIEVFNQHEIQRANTALQQISCD